MKPAILRSTAGRQLMERLAAERGIDLGVVDDLLDALDEHAGMLRRRGLFQRFDAILDKVRE